MGGDLNGVTVDVVAADGTRMPMFLTANVKSGADREPELLRITSSTPLIAVPMKPSCCRHAGRR